MKIILAILVSILLAGSAWADVAPEKVNVTGNAVEYTMCDAQATAVVCTRDGDEIVLNGSDLISLTFFSTESTATTFNCDIYSSSTTYGAGTPAGFKVNVTSLSETQEVLTLSGPFIYVWVKCTAIADNQVTIKALGQKSK